MSEVLIKTCGIQKYYQRGQEVVRAVDGIDLEIKTNESLAIVGASGSGKTTLLHLIAGLDLPTGGDLFFKDHKINLKDTKAFHQIRTGMMGYIFQKFHLIPTLTVVENVMLPLMFLKKKSVKAEVDTLLKQVGLYDRRDHLPKELSGGEMQRVAIARALITHPDLLIADEPTGNLDKKTGEDVFNLFQTLVKEKGAALVLTTHNLALAASCDRIITIEDGKII